MNEHEIEFINYDNKYAGDFRRLSFEWVKKYFVPEEEDNHLLNYPKEEIIDKGGFIFFAKKRDEIIGTAALIKEGDGIYELAKMSVTEKLRGEGIGKLLIEHCLNFAKENQFRKVILFTNTKLKSAIHIYEKYGFKKVPLGEMLFARADLKMELNII